ncbi:hypothetical protein GEMRC1_005646 [Eukaryota sp. GEM-RC1]
MSSGSMVSKSAYECPRVAGRDLQAITDDAITEFAMEPGLIVFELRHSNPSLWEYKLVNFWQLINSFAFASVDFIGSFDGSNFIEDKYFNYLVQNRCTLVNAGDSFWSVILIGSDNFFFVTQMISIVACVIVISCLILIGVFGFHRIITNISVERQGVLNLFLWVPKDTCNDIIFDLQAKYKKSKRKGATLDDQIQEQTSSDDDPRSTSAEETASDQENQDTLETQVTNETTSDSFSINGFTKVCVLSAVVVLVIVIFTQSLMYFQYRSNEQLLVTMVFDCFGLQQFTGDILTIDLLLTSNTFSFIGTNDLYFYQQFQKVFDLMIKRNLLTPFILIIKCQ